jgi:hypothetical protein
MTHLVPVIIWTATTVGVTVGAVLAVSWLIGVSMLLGVVATVIWGAGVEEEGVEK